MYQTLPIEEKNVSKPRGNYFECVQLLDPFCRKPPHDWRRWPRPNRLVAQAAINRKLAEFPKGTRVIRKRSRCDMRVDLSGTPWQLYLGIELKLPK